MDPNFSLLIFFAIVVFCSYFIIGYPLGVRFTTERSAYLCPLIGYICVSYMSMIVFYITSSRYLISIIFMILILVSFIYLILHKNYNIYNRFFLFHAIIFFLIGLIAVQGILFKPNGEYYTFSYPLYDHCKIAIISSIVNFGLPLVNPFASEPFILPYYYLFYAHGALLCNIFSVSSYQAEIILCLSSSLAMMLSIIGMYEEIFSTKISIKTFFILLLILLSGNIIDFSEYYPIKFIPYIFNHIHGFDSFMLSLVWVPQHLASAFIFIFAVFLLHKRYYNNIYYALFIALCIASSFGHSVYIGGFVACFSLIIIAIYELLLQKEIHARKKLFYFWIYIGCSSLLLSLPFIINNIISISNFSGSIVGFRLYKWSKYDNLLINIVGFYTLYYFTQYPFLYILFINSLKIKNLKKYFIFYACIFVSSIITLFLQTLIDNNDLGWRAVSVSMLISIVLCVDQYRNMSKLKKIILFIVVPLSLLNTSNFLFHCIYGYDKQYEALSSDSINAIKTYVDVNEYYVNNYNKTPLKVNLVFLILSERKSCFSSIPSLRVYGNSKILEAKKNIDNIFDGDIDAVDLKIAKNIMCDKYIFFKTDKNYYKDTRLNELGLDRIYENNEIKIWEKHID